MRSQVAPSPQRGGGEAFNAFSNRSLPLARGRVGLGGEFRVHRPASRPERLAPALALPRNAGENAKSHSDLRT